MPKCWRTVFITTGGGFEPLQSAVISQDCILLLAHYHKYLQRFWDNMIYIKFLRNILKLVILSAVSILIKMSLERNSYILFLLVKFYCL